MVEFVFLVMLNEKFLFVVLNKIWYKVIVFICRFIRIKRCGFCFIGFLMNIKFDIIYMYIFLCYYKFVYLMFCF